MSSTSRGHDAHGELLSLYAVHAVPPEEMSAAEAQIAACAECRQELESLRPVVESLVDWPMDVLRPATSLWERLERRIAAETGKAPATRPLSPRVEPEWAEVATGISCKLLSTDADRRRVSILVRLAPGADYPPHQHAAVEELYLLDGELMIDDRKLYPGDYNRAEPGTTDHRVWSETGCTCVLLTSIEDVIL